MLSRLRAIAFLLLASLCLSGCVQYDVGIRFDNQTHGAIVQHIRLGEQFTNFSGSVAQDWLKSIKQRTRKLGGRTRQINSQELAVTIPFSNGADLTDKFNQFFQPTPLADERSKTTAPEIPELQSDLKLTQSNFLLLERDRLVFDLDLRSLGVLSANGNLLVSPGSLLDLEFSLETPWGASSVGSADGSTLIAQQQGKQLVWTLKPGAVNHLEAVFWVPSPLGIGTVAIALLVAGGVYLRSQLFPAVKPQSIAPEI
jgi:Protein of unknown function (DUF3153)